MCYILHERSVISRCWRRFSGHVPHCRYRDFARFCCGCHLLSGWEKMVTWPSWLVMKRLCKRGMERVLRRKGGEIHLLMNESASQPDVCCKPGTLGSAVQAMMVNWFSSCSCRLRERVTILALDIGDSVMINTFGLTSSCRHVGSRKQCKSDQPASTPV